MASKPGGRVVLGLLLAGLPAEGHHSITGMYDTSRTVRVDGLVVEFEFVNPHAFVTLEVAQAGRGAERWRLEMDDRREMSQIGMTADTFEAGDRLVVYGNPARRAANQMYIRRLDRPADGYGYDQVGSRPQLRSPGRR
jgi:hypothetical protein